NHLTVDGQIVGSRKEPGMTSDSIHAKGRWIMNLSAQPNFPCRARVVPRIAQITQLTASLFGGRDATFERLRRPKPGLAQAKRLEDVLLRKLIEHHATDAMHYFT